MCLKCGYDKVTDRGDCAACGFNFLEYVSNVNNQALQRAEKQTEILNEIWKTLLEIKLQNLL